MSFKGQSRIFLVAVIMMMTLVVMATPAKAQAPELYLALSDTTVSAGDTTGWVSVYLSNYQDVLAAFTMRIVLDNPELIDFRTDATDTTFDSVWEYCNGWDNGVCTLWVDTLYVDTIVHSGAIDTVGTLISGWEYVTAQSFSSNRTDIKITALADALGAPYVPGLSPRTNPGLLFRLRYRAHPETADSTDNTVYLRIIDNLGETAFSDPYGDLIGVISGHDICDTIQTDPLVCDTFFRYWICQEYSGPDCIDSISTSNPDSAMYADWITIDTVAWTVRNMNTSFYTDGVVTVSFIDCVCGDANDDGLFNVGDAVFLINYIFRAGLPPAYPNCADANDDGEINVGDVVFMINGIFRGGPLPIC